MYEKCLIIKDLQSLDNILVNDVKIVKFNSNNKAVFFVAGGKVRLRQATVCPLQTSTEEQDQGSGEQGGSGTEPGTGSNKTNTENPKMGVSAGDINFVNDWVKMLTGDGCHLREHR